MIAGRRPKPSTMTGDELRAQLKALSIRQVTLAAELGVSAHTVKRWIHNQQPVPKYAALVLRLLAERADALQSA